MLKKYRFFYGAKDYNAIKDSALYKETSKIETTSANQKTSERKKYERISEIMLSFLCRFIYRSGKMTSEKMSENFKILFSNLAQDTLLSEKEMQSFQYKPEKIIEYISSIQRSEKQLIENRRQA